MRLYRIKIHTLIHLVVRQIMKLYNKKKIVCFNQLQIISDKTLYAVNHSCMRDVPVVTEILEKHNFYLQENKS